MRKFQSVDQVRFDREQLEFAVDAFLRDRGWKSKTTKIGSFCVMQKMVGEEFITADKALALGLEEHLEQERCECRDVGAYGDCTGCPLHDFKESS